MLAREKEKKGTAFGLLFGNSFIHIVSAVAPIANVVILIRLLLEKLSTKFFKLICRLLGVTCSLQV
jgi:hypothetical protein